MKHSDFKLLYEYYISTRQKGHTKLIKEGLENFDGDNIPIVITHSADMGNYISKSISKDIDFITLNSLYKLVGDNRPIVFDNAAMYVMLKSVINIIEENRELKFKLLEYEKDNPIE